MAFARSYFLGYGDRDPDLEGLEKFYVEWRDYNEYIVVQKQTDSLRIEGEIDKETIAVKCSKRGNDVYWWRVWNRIKKLYHLKEQILFDPHGNIKSSNVLFATLTYDTKHSTISEAWEREFRKSWHSHVDVQAIRKFRAGIRYVTKYLTKTKKVSETQVLTLALCWLFRKRSFAISGDLHELFLTSTFSSHRRLIQNN